MRELHDDYEYDEDSDADHVLTLDSTEYVHSTSDRRYPREFFAELSIRTPARHVPFHHDTDATVNVLPLSKYTKLFADVVCSRLQNSNTTLMM